MRDTAKSVLYRCGAMGAYHRRRNAATLTVAMFHRVLSRQDPRWADADPEWTVSDQLFGECLGFFQQHYSVIGLEQLSAAVEGKHPLPEQSLLITFDDGWSDNAEYALPRLKEAGMPAVVFVVAEGVGRIDLWEESLARTWRRGRLKATDCDELWSAVAGGEESPAWTEAQSVRDLARRLTRLDSQTRLGLLEEAGVAVEEGPRQLLSLDQLRLLSRERIAIGSHGLTHTPVPLARDPGTELQRSRWVLAELLGQAREEGPISLSFPHGRYDDHAIELAIQSGYRLIFTSDPHLHSTAARLGPVFGRIDIPASEISDDSGRLRPERLATWLFRRPIRGAGAA